MQLKNLVVVRRLCWAVMPVIAFFIFPLPVPVSVAGHPNRIYRPNEHIYAA